MGDTVLAYDPKTGKTSTQTVEATYINHDTDLLDVTLRVPGRVSVSNASSSSTATASTTTTAKHSTTATKSLASTTAHEETIHTTANHPWLTADHGWLLAGTLHMGEPVQEADGRVATVEAVRVVPGVASMWDLTVSNMHDFAVGSGAFVVHNCGVSASSYEDRVKAANGDPTVGEPNSHQWNGSQPVTDASGVTDRSWAGPDAVRNYGGANETWIDAKSNVTPGADLFAEEGSNEVNRNLRQLARYERSGRPFEYWMDARPSDATINWIEEAGGRAVIFP